MTPSDITNPRDGNFSTLGDEGRLDGALNTANGWEYSIPSTTISAVRWKTALHRDGTNTVTAYLYTWDGSWTQRDFVNVTNDTYEDSDRIATFSAANVTKILITLSGNSPSSCFCKVYEISYDT